MSKAGPFYAVVSEQGTVARRGPGRSMLRTNLNRPMPRFFPCWDGRLSARASRLLAFVSGELARYLEYDCRGEKKSLGGHEGLFAATTANFNPVTLNGFRCGEHRFH